MSKINKIAIDNRANDILKVIMSFARMEFNNKIEISGQNDVIDAIAIGVNMLGEELESSSISLKEKELLLKEIHHRVKNNLQIVSSLLNLQYGNSSDKKFLNMIRESKNRIHSMALVHEMLYASKNIGFLDFKDYVQKLYDAVSNSFNIQNNEIEFTINISENVHLDIDTMIPLGLILNEIITNTLKYAFPENKGSLFVSLQKQNLGFTLTIEDNGIGLPKDYNYQNSESLGIQLIYILAEQIDAEIKFDNNIGASYTISF